MEEDKGYTIPQVAERLGRSTRQVRRYILDGKLSARTISGKWGPEYRIDEIPEELIHPGKTSEKEEESDNNQLALQMLDSITAEYKAKINELESINLKMAMELGKSQAKCEELDKQVKLLTAPKETRHRSFIDILLRRK